VDAIYCKGESTFSESTVDAIPIVESAKCDVNGNPMDRISGAVEEMRVGPSKPACRSRLQTRQCCCGPKSHGGERLLQKSAGRGRKV
jgi:hypothetical protein